MARGVYSGVMRVGRATVFVVGLSVILALVLGVATTAMGANGDFFKLGKKNVATAVSTLVKKGAGPALKLQVGAGQPPLAVNSSARVANLNAATAGRADSAAQADSAASAQSADKLDGLDSAAFGIKTNHNWNYTDFCDTPNTWNECGVVQVTVPAGKTYLVSVWSSFTARSGASNQDVEFCSARKSPGQTAPECITPFGMTNKVTVEAGQLTGAATSGETLPLSAGTYSFSTAIKPTAVFEMDNYGKAITKVMVRDAAGATVSSAALSAADAPKANEER